MLYSNIPPKFTIPWAAAATGDYSRTIPVPSQVATTPGAASLTDGFPPLCFQPTPAYGGAGVPPDGRDMNGILNWITNALRYQQAGAFPKFDSAFCSQIGGYPQNAVLLNALGTGLWFNQVDNNTANPDAGGANWLAIGNATTNVTYAWVNTLHSMPVSTSSTTMTPLAFDQVPSLAAPFGNWNTSLNQFTFNKNGQFRIAFDGGLVSDVVGSTGGKSSFVIYLVLGVNNTSFFDLGGLHVDTGPYGMQYNGMTCSCNELLTINAGDVIQITAMCSPLAAGASVIAGYGISGGSPTGGNILRGLTITEE